MKQALWHLFEDFLSAILFLIGLCGLGQCPNRRGRRDCR
jgi:hypothetical protein